MTTRAKAQGSPITLPDGTRFQIWQDETDYRKVYYVDQQHPGAADDNPGTEEAPLLTIQAAAEVVEGAEKVVIKSGIYREWVQPRRGGTGADGMISFEAAPGAEVIIRGSRALDMAWTHSDVTLSVSVWMAELPASFFKGDHPFAVINTTDADFEHMQWALGDRGEVPHTLRRAMLFQDGRRLTQLSTSDELPRFPGTFWIDAEHHALHINPFERKDPGSCTIEATTQQFLFNPLVPGLGFIRLKGLTFEHAGNGFICFGNGAVSTWGGHHWIIEDNTVRHINSVGIEIGGRIDEGWDTGDRDELTKTTGDHLVRRNRVHDCGIGGIQGHVVCRCLVAANHIFDCGWQEVQSFQHAAGIKTVVTIDSVVQCNHIHDIIAAPGIWIDFLNRNSRVSRNLLHDIATFNGAIFYEASNDPSLIDHNVIYNVTAGSGLYQRDCDQLVIALNLVFNCDHAGVHMRKTASRDRIGVCRRNRVIGNVLAQCPVAFDYEVMENVSDGNVLSGMGEGFSLEDWQKSGLDADSRTVELDLSIDPESQRLDWSSAAAAVPTVKREELLSLEYFGRPYPSDAVPVGPFTEGWSAAPRRLILVRDNRAEGA